MMILITGAGGFLGGHVVAAALARGHRVRAMVRPASRSVPETWHEHSMVDVVRCDLRAPEGLTEAMEGVDAVIHLAATKAGDLYEQFGGTVIATERLLAAMDEADVTHLVTSSSFSVYEYLNRWEWSTLDEQSPLAIKPELRDEYCQTKLIQESLIRSHAADRGWCSVILRPGVIYGRDNLWTARLGMQAGDRYWIRVGTFAPLPLTYVENCAEATVLAAEYRGESHDLVLNVVDDESPTQRAYVRALRRELSVRPWVVPVPWLLMRCAARLASMTNTMMFRGTAKVPGLFVPARLHARCKPLRYSNDAIKQTLGWTPRYTWIEGIRRSIEDEPMELPTSSSRETHVTEQTV